jgi:hypothetical protein
VYGDEAGFVEVDGEAGCRSEVVEDLLEVGDRSAVRPTKNKSVVGVLEHRAREIWGEGVTHIAISPGTADEPLEDVSDNDENVWGEGVALSKDVTATDPVSGDTVKKDGGVPSGENLGHPIAPPLVETPSFKDVEKAPPMDGVECLLEVQFEDNGRSFPEVAAARRSAA